MHFGLVLPDTTFRCEILSCRIISGSILNTLLTEVSLSNNYYIKSSKSVFCRSCNAHVYISNYFLQLVRWFQTAGIYSILVDSNSHTTGQNQCQGPHALCITCVKRPLFMFHKVVSYKRFHCIRKPALSVFTPCFTRGLNFLE